MNILLSYPRSGNHLVRFFIELLSEKPTFGCIDNPKDIEIYKNKFNEYIPFNIKENDISGCYYKFHYFRQIIKVNKKFDKLIFLLRNPREVLLRHNMTNDGNFQIKNTEFDKYFQIIDFYLNFKGPKILFFYEDILLNREKFIKDLYNFLEVDLTHKLKYCLENFDKLYKLSANGEGRSWGGVRSNSLNFYYYKLKDPQKKEFDNLLNEKFQDEKYKFIRDKYSIEKID